MLQADLFLSRKRAPDDLGLSSDEEEEHLELHELMGLEGKGKPVTKQFLGVASTPSRGSALSLRKPRRRLTTGKAHPPAGFGAHVTQGWRRHGNGIGRGFHPWHGFGAMASSRTPTLKFTAATTPLRTPPRPPAVADAVPGRAGPGRLLWAHPAGAHQPTAGAAHVVQAPKRRPVNTRGLLTVWPSRQQGCVWAPQSFDL